MKNVRVRLDGADQAMKELKKLDERVRKKVLKKVARKVLKPVVKVYQRQITDGDEVFRVYRDGKIYAEIIPGQLRRSIGIKFPKRQNKNGFFASVGPRKSGAYRNPEKGGWYAAFMTFGWLGFRDGTKYNGQNYGFAEKAQKISERMTKMPFGTEFARLTKIEIAKLKTGQKIGLR